MSDAYFLHCALKKILNDEAVKEGRCQDNFKELDKESSGRVAKNNLVAMLEETNADYTMEFGIDLLTKESIEQIVNEHGTEHGNDVDYEEYKKIYHDFVSIIV